MRRRRHRKVREKVAMVVVGGVEHAGKSRTVTVWFEVEEELP